MSDLIQKRKSDHIKIALEKDVLARTSTYFDDVILIPKSLPELSLDEIHTNCNFLGSNFNAPILISSMTGGTKEAKDLNLALAKAADKHKIPFSVGSIKAMIQNPDLQDTYDVKAIYPEVYLIANIGLDYLLSSQFKIDNLINALKTLRADALFVHLNAAQEMAQPEGARDFRGGLAAIDSLVKNIDIPVLIKEVGHGIDPVTAKSLSELNIEALDIAGLGGTSWTAIESFRGSEIGEEFRNWGMPTALSLILCREATNLPIIASGGINNGLDIAKSIVLGADLAGMARKLLVAATQGDTELESVINKVLLELKTAMLLVGAKNILELKKTKALLEPGLSSLIDQFKQD